MLDRLKQGTNARIEESAKQVIAHLRELQRLLTEAVEHANANSQRIVLPELPYYSENDWRIAHYYLALSYPSRLTVSIDHLNQALVAAVRAKLVGDTGLAPDTFVEHGQGFYCNINGASSAVVEAYKQAHGLD